MNKNIHPTAVIHSNAKIANTVKIGPYCVIGENVTLHDNITLMSHVCIEGLTEIGEGTKIFPFASIGHEPQDLKFGGEKSRVVIGKNNKIREYVTIQPGTEGDKMETRVGDNCLLMVSSHVAHDCVIGNNVILANCATLAGHVRVGDFAIIGGLSAVHQFVRIGAHSIIGGMSGIAADVIPYGSAMGDRANLAGLNIIGMKRRNFDRETIHELRKVYTILFVEDYDNLEKRIEAVQQEYSSNKTIMEIIEFLKAESGRSICLPKDKKAV